MNSETNIQLTITEGQSTLTAGQASLSNKLQTLEVCRQADIVAVDTETTGFGIRDGTDHAYGVSLSARNKKGTLYSAYYPIRHRLAGGDLDPDNMTEEVYKQVKEVVENAPLVVFHNAKFDLVSLETLDIYRRLDFVCTLILAHLIDENRPASKSLDNCTKYYLGYYGKEKSDVLEVFIKHFGWDKIPAAMMDRYAEVDARVTLELYEKLIKKVDFG